MHRAILKSAAAAAAIMAPAILITPAAAAASSPEGVWIDSNGRGAVEIKPCGEALCGHVVWLKNSADAKGCGKQIIGDAAASGSAYTGWIYSPEDKKRYNVDISPTRDGRLKVVGYAGIRLFSKTMYWTPANPGLVRCDAQASPPAQPAPAAQQQAAVTPPPTAAGGPVSSAKAEPAANAPKVAAATPAKSAAPSASAAIRAGVPAQALAKPSGSAEGQKPLEPGVAAAEPAQAAGEEAQTAELADKPDLKRLAGVLDKVLKKSGNGGCKLDLPWLKVEFRCEDE